MSKYSSQHGKADRPCYKCGGNVFITVHSGNSRGEYAHLQAKCENSDCDMIHEYLGGTMGRVGSARKEYREIFEEKLDV